MQTNPTERPQQLARLVSLAILLAALCFIGFLVWAGRPAVAMDEAHAALVSDSAIAVATEPWLVFTPLTPTATTGLIFYPGTLVEPRAYAPAARTLAAAGYLVVIVPMPFNTPLFAPTRARSVMAAYPAITHWAIGGHGLGGVMAANFVAQHPDSVEALILWAAYPNAGDSLARQEDLVVTAIYGTRDGLVTADQVAAARTLLPAPSRFVLIEGGNHGQFGWYGDQSGDQPATIDRAAQQEQVVAATLAALAELR